MTKRVDPYGKYDPNHQYNHLPEAARDYLYALLTAYREG